MRFMAVNMNACGKRDAHVHAPDARAQLVVRLVVRAEQQQVQPADQGLLQPFDLGGAARDGGARLRVSFDRGVEVVDDRDEGRLRDRMKLAQRRRRRLVEADVLLEAVEESQGHGRREGKRRALLVALNHARPISHRRCRAQNRRCPSVAAQEMRGRFMRRGGCGRGTAVAHRRGEDVNMKILCPTDFSERGRAAARVAVDLASRTNGAVELFHVVPARTTDRVALAADAASLDDALRSDGQARLAAECRELAVEGVEVTPGLGDGDGDVESSILARAKAIAADIIVMGAHARPAVERFILGSAAERTLRRADRPVIIVPPGVYQSRQRTGGQAAASCRRRARRP